MSAMSAQVCCTNDSQRYWKMNIMRWGISLLIGMCTGVVAFVIDYFISLMSNYKFSLLINRPPLLTFSEMNEAFRTGTFAIPYFTWIFFSLFLVSIPALLAVWAVGVSVLPQPASTGSGIPQIKCFLNGIKIPQVVRIKTFIAKFVGVIFSVCAGLPIGKVGVSPHCEGPMIHSGAIISGLSQGRSSSLNLDLKFRLTTEQRDFVSIGAAAGASAAFGAPIGGLMFSLEEGSSFWNLSLIWRTFFAAVMSTFTLNILRNIVDPRYGFSSVGLIDFGTFDVEYRVTGRWWSTAFWRYSCSPLWASYSGHCLSKSTTGLLFSDSSDFYYNSRHFRYSALKVLEVLLVVGVLSILSFLCVATFDECYIGNPDTKFDSLATCSGGENSVAADYIFTTPANLVKKLFHNPDGVPFLYIRLLLDRILIKVCIPYFLASCWTYGINVPSGLFLPSMVIGGTWGRLFAQIFNALFALVGAAAQLGGNLRIVITLAVIIIEATATASLALPVIIALIMSKCVGDYFNEVISTSFQGIFDMHIHVMEIPLLDWEPPALTAHIDASKVMAHPVKTIRAVTPVWQVCDLLKQSCHHGFPVVKTHDSSVLVRFELKIINECGMDVKADLT
ncbi:LOW QUALITY PROTEIN: H(+)/Cl(-) exchange transporter 7-like [Octopus sinensis]|uniref:LOW QUALITY PROTEIN: H(+)/Cl(-) exchange transporter 7-like n=1 Tax=Octopus sinensis TaxID=2607531 RepID=A0A7E6EI55_9MOLL|nr:LOW QUALITY PROTEIN: H(+)/Cl(-) exchange transporter 7-like [Octopus sinensis]